MKRLLIVILICLMLPIHIFAQSYGKTGASTDFNGDVGVPSGSGYYINGVLLSITDLTTYSATLKIGRDADNLIDFTTDNKITYRINATDYLEMVSTGLIPVSDSAIDLGSSTPKYFANAYIDKIYLNSTASLDGSTAGRTDLVGTLNFTNVEEVKFDGTTYIYMDTADAIRAVGLGKGACNPSAISGQDNVAIGAYAMSGIQAGTGNLAIGAVACAGLTSGGQNIGIGGYALYTCTTGEGNTAIGNSALREATGNYNVGIGQLAGYAATGSNSVFLGYGAGRYETAGSKLFIDNTYRASEADGRLKALIYGIFAANVVDQSLTVNAKFQATRQIETVVAMADGDVTPDVSAGNVFVSQENTGATEITDLDNPTVGQIVTIICGHGTNAPTIADGGNFALSAAWNSTLDDVIVLFVQADNDYIEVSRSIN